MAFKVMYYSSSQSDSSVEFSSFKHEVVIAIPYKAQNKT